MKLHVWLILLIVCDVTYTSYALCSEGMKSNNGICEPCPAGYWRYSYWLDDTHCVLASITLCSEGEQWNTDSNECEACPAGYWRTGQLSECKDAAYLTINTCSDGEQWNTDSNECEACPVGYWRIGQLSECKDAAYLTVHACSENHEWNNNTHMCEACPNTLRRQNRLSQCTSYSTFVPICSFNLALSNTLTADNMDIKIFNPDTIYTICTDIDSIGISAFEGTAIRSIHIPGTVKTIDSHAFHKSDLHNVLFDEGIEEIGDNAFAFTSIMFTKLPNTITDIGVDAFADNLNIIHIVEWPENIQTITGFAYTGLQQISTLPSSVHTIGIRAFAHTPLKDIHLPVNVTRIDDDAFKSSDLETCTTNGTILYLGAYAFFNTQIKDFDTSTLIDMGADAFYQTNIEQATLRMKTIPSGAFMNTPLKNVTLDNVLTIERNAFRNTLLESIDLPPTITNIGENAFAYTSISYIVYPKYLNNIASAFIENNMLRTIKFSHNMTSIPNYCCSGLEHLEHIDIRNTIVGKVGNGAFFNSPKLSNILSNSETLYIDVGLDSFRFTNIQEITLSAGSTFSDTSFNADTIVRTCCVCPTYRTILTNATNQTTLTNATDQTTLLISREHLDFSGNSHIIFCNTTMRYIIDSYTFHGINVRSIDFGSVTTINSNAFRSTMNFLQIPARINMSPDIIYHENNTDPNFVRDRYIRTFCNDDVGKKLYLHPSQTIQICNTINQLADRTFETYSFYELALTFVELGNYTFRNTRIHTLRWNELITTIPAYTFEDAQLTNLENIDSVEIILNNAFENCTLTNFRIPASIRSIHEKAFFGTRMTSNIFFIGSQLEFIHPTAFDLNHIQLHIEFNSSFHLNHPNVQYILCPQHDTLTAEHLLSHQHERIIICDNVKHIAPNTFKNYPLKSIQLPTNLETIGAAAFESTLLESITIPSQIHIIQENTFKHAPLKNISGMQVTEINEFAFHNTSLQYVDLSHGIQYIYRHAFTETNIEDGIRVAVTAFVHQDAFDGTHTPFVCLENSDTITLSNNPVKNVKTYDILHICDTILSLDDDAFKDYSIRSIQLGSGITSIGDRCFMNTNLSTINIPIASIGIHAFKNTQISYNHIPRDIKEYNNWFGLCDIDSLHSFPNIKNIGDYAFKDCKNIDTFDLTNIDYVGKQAFYNSSIASFTISDTTYLDDLAFAFCKNLTPHPMDTNKLGKDVFAYFYVNNMYIANKNQWCYRNYETHRCSDIQISSDTSRVYISTTKNCKLHDDYTYDCHYSHQNVIEAFTHENNHCVRFTNRTVNCIKHDHNNPHLPVKLENAYEYHLNPEHISSDMKKIILHGHVYEIQENEMFYTQTNNHVAISHFETCINYDFGTICNDTVFNGFETKASYGGSYCIQSPSNHLICHYDSQTPLQGIPTHDDILAVSMAEKDTCALLYHTNDENTFTCWGTSTTGEETSQANIKTCSIQGITFLVPDDYDCNTTVSNAIPTQPVIYGCKAKHACNYNNHATIHMDTLCIFPYSRDYKCDPTKHSLPNQYYPGICIETNEPGWCSSSKKLIGCGNISACNFHGCEAGCKKHVGNICHDHDDCASHLCNQTIYGTKRCIDPNFNFSRSIPNTMYAAELINKICIYPHGELFSCSDAQKNSPMVLKNNVSGMQCTDLADTCSQTDCSSTLDNTRCCECGGGTYFDQTITKPLRNTITTVYPNEWVTIQCNIPSNCAYNPFSTSDRDCGLDTDGDGICDDIRIGTIKVCGHEEAINYKRTLDDDEIYDLSVCTFDDALYTTGCMDPNACNYNPYASIQTIKCIYPNIQKSCTFEPIHTYIPNNQVIRVIEDSEPQTTNYTSIPEYTPPTREYTYTFTTSTNAVAGSINAVGGSINDAGGSTNIVGGSTNDAGGSTNDAGGSTNDNSANYGGYRRLQEFMKRRLLSSYVRQDVCTLQNLEQIYESKCLNICRVNILCKQIREKIMSLRPSSHQC